MIHLAIIAAIVGGLGWLLADGQFAIIAACTVVATGAAAWLWNN